ncbi:MAG: hypothetical protein KF836_11565 [Fimbriimonadaceae bacterium]|nr:hypothetical protein [Fimbriimonadaceae bacterium]
MFALVLTALCSFTAQTPDLSKLDGEWIYVEDMTEGRTLEQLGPPMSGKFSMSTEPGAVILVSGHGSGNTNVRVALDGSHTQVPGATEGTYARYSGGWKEGTFTYNTDFVRAAGKEPEGLIKKEMSVTDKGLVVRVKLESINYEAVGLYRHPQDIEMPTPAKATINDLQWLAGNWAGTRGTGGSIAMEERWSPPKGGSMLAVSRTFSRDRLSAFEYLRILERNGGLVYIAQPNGAAPTEFILSELGENRAVFDNPRHDYPKRIVYELSPDGSLTATIGFMKGGTPRRYEYKRESTH